MKPVSRYEQRRRIGRDREMRKKRRKTKWKREMELWEKIRAQSLGTCDRWSSWISCPSLCDWGCCGHFVCSNSTMEEGWGRNLCFPTRFSTKNCLSVFSRVRGFAPVTNWNVNKVPNGKRREFTEPLWWCCHLCWRTAKRREVKAGFLLCFYTFGNVQQKPFTDIHLSQVYVQWWYVYYFSNPRTICICSNVQNQSKK